MSKMSLSLCGDFQSLAHQVTLIVHEKNPKFNYAMNLKSKIWIKKSMNTSAIFYDTVLTASQKPADKTKKSTIQKWCWYFDAPKHGLWMPRLEIAFAENSLPLPNF